MAENSTKTPPNNPKPPLKLVRLDPNDWRLKLRQNSKGTPKKEVYNAILILKHDHRWEGVLAYDEFAFDVVTMKPPPWPNETCGTPVVGHWTEEDTTRCVAWLQENHDLVLGPEVVYSAVKIVALQQKIHPVREYLDTLVWDGVPRLDTWLHEYLGAENTRVNSVVGACFLISAVARVFRPGCKVDTVPVLIGAQGVGKSTMVKALFSDQWFTEMTGDVDNKDTAIGLQSRWGVEISELASINRSNNESTKRFITCTDDRYRDPYGKKANSHPRGCVFVATTNEREFLRDHTGGRRWWPIQCGRVDIDSLGQDRDALWAEARHYYDMGYPWHITDPEVIAALAELQDERIVGDPWADKVAEYCTKCDLQRTPITIAGILEHGMQLPIGQWPANANSKVGVILRKLGYRQDERVRVGNARQFTYIKTG
jgi:putative DNA primase/helicase